MSLSSSSTNVVSKLAVMIIEDFYEAMPDVVPSNAAADGITAIALYDYQAADDDELSFDPDDRITNIEKVGVPRGVRVCRWGVGVREIGRAHV